MLEQSDLPFMTSLISGGVAGLTVDLTLFPLDTIKTRLQSQNGLFTSGGFHNLYKGIGTVAVGSAPTAAVFFCTYNTMKKFFYNYVNVDYYPLVHMAAATIGEVGTCLLRVPIEVIKQRQQASLTKLTPLLIIKRAIEMEGYLGLYRGFTTTIFREIPFSLIQFPMWEWLKLQLFSIKNTELSIIEVAACGSLAGGVAAAVTTPLDVAKTRIMLAEKNIKASKVDYATLHTFSMLLHIYKEKGVTGLFSGLIPRTLWITIGGAVFFGAYQTSVEFCSKFYRNETMC